MTSRQEIYDRIRSTSRDEVILEEMIRLGFWPRDTGLPDAPADAIRREGELTRELRALTTENKRLHNVKALKKAARQRRMAESRANQQATKERRLQQRAARAAAWNNRKRTEVMYLGADVSKSLNQQESDEPKLKSRGLPVAANVLQLAQCMETTVAELRFLAFDRRTATVNHYQRFGIPKKTGGIRRISAPKPRLKCLQQWVLNHILENVEIHDAAHGFRRGRSIVTNATPHVGAEIVINADMEDFFPTVGYPRIRGVFRSLGYSHQVSTVLALLCSEADVEEVMLDNRTWFVAKSERRLPQGAPSSPALTNIICRGLDARIAHNAKELGFVYTRYADDMTFSGSGDALQNVPRMFYRAKFIVEKEGFKLHPRKTRYFRRGRRQEVTGLVVNEKLSVNRRIMKKFRATLFQIEKDGPDGKRWGQSPHVLSAIEGFANFVAMVDPAKGRDLQQRVGSILETHRQSDPFGGSSRARWQGKPASDPSLVVVPQVSDGSGDATKADAANESQGTAAENSAAATTTPSAPASSAGSAPPASQPSSTSTPSNSTADGHDWNFTVVPADQTPPPAETFDTQTAGDSTDEPPTIPPPLDGDDTPGESPWWKFWN